MNSPTQIAVFGAARRRTGKRKNQAKFKRVSRICNRKSTKTARKACWKSHYCTKPRRRARR
jgi:hypothetical protein